HAAKRRALIGGEWGVRVGLDAIANQLKAVLIFPIMVRPHPASSSTRQSNAKCRVMRSDWGYRQCSTMSFDNQPANCQPHPHATGLCREEGVKDTADVFLLYARAGIFDGNLYAVRVEWP